MALTLRLPHRSHARQAVVLGEILLIHALASVATFKVSANDSRVSAIRPAPSGGAYEEQRLRVRCRPLRAVHARFFTFYKVQIPALPRHWEAEIR